MHDNEVHVSKYLWDRNTGCNFLVRELMAKENKIVNVVSVFREMDEKINLIKFKVKVALCFQLLI